MAALAFLSSLGDQQPRRAGLAFVSRPAHRPHDVGHAVAGSHTHLVEQECALHRDSRKNHSGEVSRLQKLDQPARYLGIVIHNVKQNGAAVPCQHDLPIFRLAAEFRDGGETSRI